MPGNTKNKVLTPTDREKVLATIARLDRRGMRQVDIANTLHSTCGIELSQQMVSVYLKNIREEYKKSRNADVDADTQEKIEQLRDIRCSAWDAWERSQLDKEKLQEEYVRVFPKEDKDEKLKGGKGKKSVEAQIQLLKRIATREGRLPANEYLNTVLKCLQLECELMGLIDRKPVNNTTVNGNVTILDLINGTTPLPLGEAPPNVVRVVEAEVVDTKGLSDESGNTAGSTVGNGEDTIANPTR